MNHIHRQLLTAAKTMREKADAYEALAEQVNAIQQKKTPPPIREMAIELSKLGLCLAPRSLMLRAVEHIDPTDDEMPWASETETASDIRNVLDPEQADQKNYELLP